ncbi:hypothetical protein Leryth_012527 [Lithospermum erythrorhizon]|nr:hypothetical protein Leryth_012527 [Lithospermum erythrorhizon]
MGEQSDRKRERCDSLEEEDFDLPEVKKLRQDLLDNLEDDEICSTSADLDSFMRSFEEEISSTNIPPMPKTETNETNLALEANDDPLPNIGYLLEASDDELGLPPSSSSPSQLGDELWGFQNVSSFDSFGLTELENINGVGNNNEYVELDGLFDYSDMGFGTDGFVC